MNRTPLLVSLAIAAGLTGGGIIGYRWWRAAVVKRTEATTIAQARSALEQGRARETLAVLDRAPAPPAADATAWQDLEVEAAAKALQMERLSGIWQRTPARILKHEAASLIVYRWLSARGETQAAESLLTAWQGKAQNPSGWTLAQVDALMGNGKGEDARKLLEAERDWQPTDEPERLVRLALLQARTDLNAAWKLLEKASELAPRHADVRSFRGQILEAAGRLPEARVEYVAALVAEPGNPLRRDQLASFYVRLGDYDHAVPTWLEGAADAGDADFLRLKGRFWAQVVQPALGANFKTPAAADYSSPWRAALDAIELAPPGKWLAMVPGGAAAALREHGEIWWLELLDRLQAGDLEVAEALDTQPVKAAVIAPDLSAALRTVLALRNEKPLNGIIWPPLAPGAARPSYFRQLEQLTTAARAAGGQAGDEPTLALARHPAGLAYVFAVAGWREATLRLQPWENTPNLPEPMLYTVAMCMKFNRGAATAAALLKDPPSPLLQGLAGECLLASGEVAAGLKQLQSVAKDPSAAGQRAAWLLALAYLERRDLAAARAVVADSPRLAGATSGQEILARIALAENNQDEATRLYRQAAEAGSVEGRTWLLRQAVAAGNAAEAKKESMILREQLPDEMQTRANQLKLPPEPPAPPAP